MKRLWLAFWIGDGPLVRRPRLDRHPHLPGDAADPPGGRDDGRHGGHRPGEIGRTERLARWAAWRSAPSGDTAATWPRTGRPTGCTARPCSCSNDWAQAEYQTSYDAAAGGAAGAAARAARADCTAPTPTTRPPARSPSIRCGRGPSQRCLAHYSDVFMKGETELRDSGRHGDRSRAAAAAGGLLLLDVLGGRRPIGPATASPTRNNWPHEPLVGNRPTGETVVWTGVSIIMLLAGICAMVWWYASQKRHEEPGPLPATDPLGELAGRRRRRRRRSSTSGWSRR